MPKNKKELASIKTTQNLIAIARKHFSKYGYAKTSLEAIVEELAITRGALYHHFKGKKELFLAVLNQVQTEVGANVEKEAMTSEDIWEQLTLGCVGFVEAATLEANRRILLIDAPNVIDWTEWRKIDNENSVALLEEQLLVIQEKGELVALDTRLMAHLISGALNDLSLYQAESDSLTKDAIQDAITYLLKGFRVNGHEG
ncbi:TetR/AcrR family transcriptional regulator [Enterococcus sp. BWR-S5]|uniref:TetR/AcrR family transcriptional regulator n=1 Tax=Enterococcus sp. BWR-S5 TaxID=2787714 RepID=UPI00192256B9|nr:TetR/AcrR family transcriptional regulator [Enterococcus sp. BWR-S5]MBL1225275.1 TetR/AcrR family transcriptional regulator [Enterococcus sp. BWR-S5]